MMLPSPAVGLPKNRATKPSFALIGSLDFQRRLGCCAPGTGTWVFDTPEYKSWHDGDLQTLLTIRGPLGSGKSVLAASIVNKLQQTESDVPCLFYFCPKRPHTPLLKSPWRKSLSFGLVLDWLVQAVEFVPGLQDTLEHLSQGLRGSSRHREWKWSDFDCVDVMQLWKLLVEAVEDFPKVYCVIDHVDAFQDPENVEFLKELLRWKDLHPGNVKILFTSNSVTPIDNEISLGMDNENLRQDVCTFLDAQLKTFGVPEDTKSKIGDALVSKSFLYVRLWLFLTQDSDIMSISQLLNERNPTLYALYDRILEKCRVGPLVAAEYRRTVLSLILYAARRLRRLEILAALEVQYGSQVNHQHLIQSAFGPLLEFVGDETPPSIHESFIAFVHDKNRSPESQGLVPVVSPADVHQHLGSISIKCLMGSLQKPEELADGNWGSTKAWDDAKKSHPLLDYAASNWFLHARELPNITGEFRELLLQWWGEGKECAARWIEEICKPDKKAISSIAPIHVAAWTGAPAMIPLALELGCSYNQRMSDGTSPLAVASMYGHEEHGDNAIDLAARQAHLNIVRILAEANANVNITEEEKERSNRSKRDSRRGTCDQAYPRSASAFSKALTARNMEVARYLISFANDPHDFAKGLDDAATEGNIPKIELLLSSPLANVNGKWSRDTPLFRAGLSHHYDTMKFLLERGADPNIASRGLRSHGCIVVGWKLGDPDSIPLHAVAGFGVGGMRYWRSVDEARLEKAQKCSWGRLYLTDEDGKSPLDKIGSDKKSLATIEILTKHGLKLDEARGPEGKIPLHSMVQGLRAMDVFDPTSLDPYVTDWNIADKDGNAILNLLIGSYASNPESISKLVQIGCDVQKKNKDGLTPLHTLCQHCISFNVEERDAVVKLLVKAGADIEAKDAKGCTPLHHLVQASTNRPSETQQLIPRFVHTSGSNINAIDEDGNGILHMLFQGEPSSIFTELVDLGADPRLTNFKEETIVHHLMKSRLAEKAAIPVDFVQRLLEYGLSSTARDRDGNTPLHILCRTRLSPKSDTWPSDQVVDVLLSADGGKKL
ncbi:Ankyrin repeat-containing protein [Penicillium canariense]|uniref:Ankyrin repeat-containing protein n=1 Tax=Penicillium canariense TaxID=189055 RepID=A0A9W9HMX9_9EURO|nr:Ankyrin repeat-containing protein [Penicillium canariense]KAJ5151182.1 Ankyrin repeat-containing protein [Penicillium canariense]